MTAPVALSLRGASFRRCGHNLAMISPNAHDYVILLMIASVISKAKAF